ncbi:MAG: crossover junction endodeoxyribonuclease RuvC [Pseudomonadota bacterium]
MRVLGLDPGLRRLGWGVIETEGSHLRHLANGTCRTEGGTLAARLLELHTQLSAIVARWGPDEAAVEQTFVNRDGAATLKLGQARAIALLVPAQAGMEVGEYAPNAVKKAVVGVGHADKAQIAHMIGLQFPGLRPDSADAADALAVALAHLFHRRTSARYTDALRRAGA